MTFPSHKAINVDDNPAQPSQAAKMPVGISKKKKKSTRGFESETYARRLLATEGFGLRISPDALHVFTGVIEKLEGKMDLKSMDIAKMDKAKTTKPKHIEAAARLVLTDEMAEGALPYGEKAVKKFNKAKASAAA